MRDPQLDNLRVTTIQRDNAVAALREGAADGRLTFDELGSRIPLALAAVTRGDLVRVIDDLVPPDQLDTVIADPMVQGEGPGFRWDEPLMIGGHAQDKIRVGAWQLPPFIEVQLQMGTTRLNCFDAVPLASVIDIVLVGASMMGALIVVVPEGWGVDTAELVVSGQAIVTSGVRTRPERGKPRLVLRGRTSGNVTVRTPTWWDRKAIEKARRQAALEGRPIRALEPPQH